MGRYRCKPVMVDAFQMSAVDTGDWPDWAKEAMRESRLEIMEGSARVKTLEGWVTTPLAAYLVRSEYGEIWPVQKRLFEAKYEKLVR